MLNFAYRFAGAALSIVLLTTCSSDPTHQVEHGTPAVAAADRQVNMTVLLDLSNRINATFGQDNQQNRDVAIVHSTASWFRDWIGKKGGFKAKGLYYIYFEPQPTLAPDLNGVANSLQFDLSTPGLAPAAKKKVYDEILPKTTTGVKTLYQYVAKQPFIGSDIWVFAKDKMASRCIKDSTKYRNVLVLVTDGYIDHVNTRFTEANKTSYINDAYIDLDLVKRGGFTRSNWVTKYESGKYGLIPPPGASLKGLEVLVLEVNTYKRPVFYTDLVKHYVKDWFHAMGASRVEVRSTDLPVNTAKEIRDFMGAPG